MAPSPEDPTGGAPSPAQKDVAAFVIGLIVGLGVGGVVLTMIFFFTVAAIVSLVFPKTSNNLWFTYFGTIPAVALGWWAVMQSRKAMNFVSGGLIGLAAGMLGGVSLCGFLMGSLGNMK